MRKPSISPSPSMKQLASRAAVGLALAGSVAACSTTSGEGAKAPAHSFQVEDRNTARNEAEAKITSYVSVNAKKWASEGNSRAEVKRRFQEELEKFARAEGIDFGLFDKEPRILREVSGIFKTSEGEEILVVVAVSSTYGIAADVSDPDLAGILLRK